MIKKLIATLSVALILSIVTVGAYAGQSQQQQDGSVGVPNHCPDVCLVANGF
jgi:hypothetical protein